MNRARLLLCSLLIGFLTGCANIVPPTGGAKDVKAPVLLAVSPADSLRNERPKRIDLRFDEYVELNEPGTQITVAPMLAVPLTVTSSLRRVSVILPDTLLQGNTTYRIAFNKAIKDLNEGNFFEGYNYTFSTGAWFDSLALRGMVYDAFTGKPDTSSTVMLYDASLPDSSVVRIRPSYVTRVNGQGIFDFGGLPARRFRIYALQDGNGNFIFDGGKEKIAFQEAVVTPGDSAQAAIQLQLFAEPDTAAKNTTAEENSGKQSLSGKNPREVNGLDPETFTFVAGIDTSDLRRRTQELDEPIIITFSRKVAGTFANRLSLTYDSSGVAVEAPVRLITDSIKKHLVTLKTTWKPDQVYTLRLLKGFAKDSTGADALPVKYVFRTRRDEDYAKLHVHLSSVWGKGEHLLVIRRNADTFYHQRIRDTMLHFMRLQPGTYSMMVVHDLNKDSVWTTGDLFGKRQPEPVIPYRDIINLKPGWENIIDFLPEADDRARPRGKR